jgi:hypothetical protein
LQRLKAKYQLVRAASVFLLLAVVFLAFRPAAQIPLAEQWVIYDGLRQTASIIFGVLGIWIAIVYPDALSNLLKASNSVPEKHRRRVKVLFRPMIWSTGIIAYVSIVGLIAPLLASLSLPELAIKTLRSLSFCSLIVLTGLQLWALIYSLVPLQVAEGEVDGLANEHKGWNAYAQEHEIREKKDKPS